MRPMMFMTWALFQTALLASGCAPKGDECGPSAPPNAPLCGVGEECIWIWLPDKLEGRSYCAPMCGDGGVCPTGLSCEMVADAYCQTCRVSIPACIDAN